MMIDDGCPETLLRDGVAPKIRQSRKSDGTVTLAPPIAIQKAIAAEFVEASPPEIETKMPEALAPPAPENKIGKAKKVGSKTEIVAALLRRPEGCTTAEILSATNWPSVSVPAAAKSAGLTLKKEKDGKISRYWGT